MPRLAASGFRRPADALKEGIDRLLPERRQQLVDAAVSGRASKGLERVKARGWPIVQTAIAAALAWLVATMLLGHPQPFLAPVSAIIALGVTRGQRGRQAIEMMLGVAVGIAVGDLLIYAIGTGVWQLGLVVVLAMAASLIIARGGLLATQAAVSAALVATVDAQTGEFVPDRFFDALVGGAIALLFSQVLFPVDPVRLVREAVDTTLAELAEALEDIASALQERDLEAAEWALVRARRVSGRWSHFEEAIELGRESARYAPPRRRRREHFELYEEAVHPLDLTVRDVQVLARGAVRALRIGDQVPPELPNALLDLARAVQGVARHLRDGGEEKEVGKAARRAAERATAVLDRDENVSLSMLVGHVQATSVDALRSVGVERIEAHEGIGEVARAAQFGDGAVDGESVERSAAEAAEKSG
jgi:uncharacterized membrane protein YgaE (UPF0421/DUF939 family)